VGDAGVTGYLAAMALFGMSSDQMRPTALVLNIFVATIGTIRFCRAGYFSWKLFLPFAIGSIPLAFIGGALPVAPRLYKQLLGGILLLAALQLFVRSLGHKTEEGVPLDERRAPAPPPVPIALLCGAGIGILAGLTGTGGGIFLSPLILLMNWADPKKTAGVSVVFILVNSIAGILGQFNSQLASLHSLPHGIYLWGAAAILGGVLGSWLGARRFGNPTIRRMLAIVLVIAGSKFIFAKDANKPDASQAATTRAHPP